MVTNNGASKKVSTSHYIAVTGMLTAVAVVLQYLEFPLPFMPPFIKFDFSDLPALIGAFALGPGAGVIICLLKNVIHLAVSQSMLVGELSNFMLGAVFVLTAGLIYKHHKTKKTALIGGISGALAMGIFRLISNYFIVYPVYYKVGSSEEVILRAYNEVITFLNTMMLHIFNISDWLPTMDSIFQSLVCFNLPFTIVKGLIDVIIVMLIYHPLSPILKGRKQAA